MDVTGPDFIVAGARRCGTTWLHRCLGEHPDIALPAATKELFFFDRNWARGVDWYARYFHDCPPGKLRGEVSPSYFASPQAPARIKALLPEVRLVFALRNPLERVVSLYHHLRISGDIGISLEAALDTGHAFLREGFYAQHLQRFRDVFADDRILVLIREDADSGGLAPLFGFLHVRSDFVPPSLHERVNARREARARLPALAATRLSRALHNAGWHGAVEWAKAAGADKLFVRRRSTARASASVAKRVHEIYDDDTRRLGQVLGRDLGSIWKY